MASRNVILAAHLIKIGIPFGLLTAASILIYAMLFRETGVQAEVIGQSVAAFVVTLIGSLVLGLMRANRKQWLDRE